MNNHESSYENFFNRVYTFEMLGNIVICAQKKMVSHFFKALLLMSRSDHFAKFVFHKRLILKRELYEKQQ